MGIVAWLKNLWKGEEVEYVCPQKKKKNIGYSSIISNYVQVIRDGKSPEYIQIAKCCNCGFTSKSEDDTYLKPFERKICE